MSSSSSLYLIDATAFCYRAFYAIRSLSTSKGQPTNAVYGFVTMLQKFLKENQPQQIAVCFDVSRKTVRQQKYAAYKIQRPATPNELISQFPYIKRIVQAYGLALIEKEGYEADDIIATLAQKARRQGSAVIIVTSDKDMLQLVDSATTVLNPAVDPAYVYDEAGVQQRFGVPARRIPDLIALAGDPSDNIPGAKGIGEKTAQKLLARFDSVEQVLAGIPLLEQEKLRTILSANKENIVLSKELAVLDTAVDIDISIDGFKPAQPDWQQLYAIFQELEFKKLLRTIPIASEPVAANIPIQPLNGENRAVVDKAAEVVIACGSGMAIVVADGQFLQVDLSQIRPVLEDARVRKVGYDLKRVRNSLAAQGIELTGVYFDVMIAAYLLNPSKLGYSLPDIAYDMLGRIEQPCDDDPLRQAQLIAVLKPELQHRLIQQQLDRLFYDMEMPLVEVLSDMERVGIKLDVALLHELSGILHSQLLALIDKIYEFSGVHFNINSPKQLRQILFEQLKLPVIKRSKTGPSTDEEVLYALSRQHDLPRLLLQYRQLTKLKSTYIDASPALVDPVTHTVHTSFNQAGTETGRLSSLRPNLQNIPVKTDLGRRIREAVIAFSSDSFLLSCDYSQVELRILAHLSADSVLVEDFRNGRDVHCSTAASIYGIALDQVTKEMRDTAKRVNFGIVYGLTAFGLAKDLHIAVDEAQAFIDAYFKKFQGVKVYIDEQIARAQHDGYVTTMCGRRRYVPEITSPHQAARLFAQRQAVNTPIQGSASDLIKLAMIDIHALIRQKKLRTRMILQVHDELLFDVPESEWDTFAPLAQQRMERVLQLSVPIEVDMYKGRNWSEMEEVS